MGIVISSGLVLSQGFADQNANNPLVGWENLVSLGGLAADFELDDWPVANLANPFTHLPWISENDQLQYVTITLSGSDLVDYVGIAGHNFGSGLISVLVEGYSDLDSSGDPDWFELAPEVMPANDGPLLFRFDPQVLIGVRIRMLPMTGVASPRMAVVYVGKLLVLQRRIYVGHKPMSFAERIDNVIGRSDRGQFLGSIVLSSWNESSIQQSNVSPTFYRNFIEPWREQSVALRKSFFFAWRPSSYSAEVAYCWPSGDMDVSNQLANGLMQFSLNIQGIVK